jgi:hypothetical protein
MSIPIRPYILHSLEVSNLSFKIKSGEDVESIKIKRVAFLKLDKTFYSGSGHSEKIKEFKLEAFQNNPCSSCQNTTPNGSFCGFCGNKLSKPIDEIDVEILRYEIFDEEGNILDKNLWDANSATKEIIQHDYFPAYDMENKYEIYLNTNHGIDFVKFDPDRFVTKFYKNPLKEAYEYEIRLEDNVLVVLSISLALISVYFSYTWSEYLFILGIPLSLFAVWVIYETLKKVFLKYLDFLKVNRKYNKSKK